MSKNVLTESHASEASVGHVRTERSGCLTSFDSRKVSVLTEI